MFDIIADSACDLGPEKAKALRVKLVPFYVSSDGQEYKKEGEELNVREFYRLLAEHPELSPKTSLPSLDDYMRVFEPYAKEGRPVLCLCYTGKMSGSAGCARNARDILLDEYPDARIETMDSTAATVTEAMMVENACAMRDAGWTLEQAVTWLKGCAPTNQIFFTVGNLDYLIRGGRIGKAKGMAANLLNIKPMIHFHDGEIFSGGVARGRLKSIEKAIEQLLNYLTSCNANPDDYRITVGYGCDEEEGRRLWMQVRAALRAKFPGAACEVGMLQIGATICVHTGPYPLGVGVMRRWRPQNA
jgi:DegV family protein with EDD domain